MAAAVTTTMAGHSLSSSSPPSFSLHLRQQVQQRRAAAAAGAAAMCRAFSFFFFSSFVFSSSPRQVQQRRARAGEALSSSSSPPSFSLRKQWQQRRADGQQRRAGYIFSKQGFSTPSPWLGANTMGGKKPITILTDHDHAMANALDTRWPPETCHRLCIWHIYQNAAIHLSGVFEKYKDFAHHFGKCIYDCEEDDEFMREWDKMLEKYDIMENEWLKRLFRVKEKWALVYGRQFFCADITTTQRSESMNSVVKRFVSSKNPLRVFFERFENLIVSHRYEELIADFKARTSALVLPLPVQLLKHVASVYTPKVFKDFQNELGKAYDCAVVLSDIYEIAAAYHVSYLGRSSCKKFEFGGLLCDHALKVLTNNNVFKIPKQYVMKRWTKSAKSGVVFSLEDGVDDPKKMAGISFKDESSSGERRQRTREGDKDKSKNTFR
ncbi:protein FAR1-RELATED SEQUENCE 5-like [Andrographis paniculata]|uniref:protein FAR1-RELATED SEQUENCE 5-like n=1 Tax=Andrographis paniculata TaxID=175694 RepID=UPI0021E8904D|nr:protein FAR1-RELATED SEQUENCE 5-like [Andrographis paniculata]